MYPSIFVGPFMKLMGSMTELADWMDILLAILCLVGWLLLGSNKVGMHPCCVVVGGGVSVRCSDRWNEWCWLYMAVAATLGSATGSFYGNRDSAGKLLFVFLALACHWRSLVRVLLGPEYTTSQY
jgi:hypothetical protein